MSTFPSPYFQNVVVNGTLTADGILRSANNLSDVSNVSTSRANLGLGSLAVLSSVNNANWSGTVLAITNGGTGASTAATALTNLGAAKDRSTVTALTNSSGVVNVDWSLGDYFTLTLAANVTSVTSSNLPASGFGRTICIDVVQDATGSRTFAVPSSWKAIGSSDTAIQSAANAKTRIILSTVDGGTTKPYSMAKVAA